MTAYVTSPTATYSNGPTITTAVLGWNVVVLDWIAAPPEPILPPLNPKGLFGGDLLTWLFWTAWQFAPPRYRVELLPKQWNRNAIPLSRPRVRARRHAPNHSPRRLCYAHAR